MLISLLVFACSGNSDKEGGSGLETSDTGPETQETVTALGAGDGELDPDSVVWTPILTEDDKLDDPRDLGFDTSGDLWVANRDDDHTFIVFDPGTDEQDYDRRRDGYAQHFMEETAAFSFDDDAQFGSCGESENTYNDHFAADEFMGPVLWSTDLDIFAEQNPEGLGSHLDMQHESPLCVGIAWETDNVYWVFDGKNSTVVRYDFQQDHGVGQDDHSDGIVYRLVEPEVTRVEDAPGHMMIDHATGLLYVADTGNGRVLVIDTASGERGDDLHTRNEDLADYAEWVDVTWSTLIEGLDRPGGLAMDAEHLYIGEWGTGLIHVYDLDGNSLQTLDTGLGEGALYGIEIGPDGALWVAEIATPGVYRLDPT